MWVARGAWPERLESPVLSFDRAGLPEQRAAPKRGLEETTRVHRKITALLSAFEAAAAVCLAANYGQTQCVNAWLA